jgi:hypothetical protein
MLAGGLPYLSGDVVLEVVDACGMPIRTATANPVPDVDAVRLSPEHQALVFAVGSSLDMAAEFRGERKGLTMRVLNRAVALVDGITPLAGTESVSPSPVLRVVFGLLRTFLEELLQSGCDADIIMIAIDSLFKLARSSLALTDFLALVRDVNAQAFLPSNAHARAEAEFSRLLEAADAISTASFKNRPLPEVHVRALVDPSMECLSELATMLQEACLTVQTTSGDPSAVRTLLRTAALLRLSAEAAVVQRTIVADNAILDIVCASFDVCSRLALKSPRLLIELETLVELSVRLRRSPNFDMGILRPDRMGIDLPSSAVLSRTVLSEVGMPAQAFMVASKVEPNTNTDALTCFSGMLEQALGNGSLASEKRRLVRLLQLELLKPAHTEIREQFTTALIIASLDRVNTALGEVKKDTSIMERVTTRLEASVGALLAPWMCVLHKQRCVDAQLTPLTQLLAAVEGFRSLIKMPAMADQLQSYHQDARGMVTQVKLVESRHPYLDDTNQTEVLKFASKQSIRVVWDPQCSTERGCDKLEVRNHPPTHPRHTVCTLHICEV